MKIQVMGVYREPEYSPGKVEADAAILDAVVDQLAALRAETTMVDSARFAHGEFQAPHLVLAMCQGEHGLARLSTLEEAGAVVINSALAIRNCYRDLLGAGLMRAGVPVPEGVLVRTAAPLGPGIRIRQPGNVEIIPRSRRLILIVDPTLRGPIRHPGNSIPAMVHYLV